MSERVRARHNLVTGLRLRWWEVPGLAPTPDRIYHVFLSFKFSQIRSGAQLSWPGLAISGIHVNLSA